MTAAASRDVAEPLHHRPGLVRVVAVDGHSAAGKSTFAAALTTHFGATLVRGDDLYRVMNHDHRAALTPAEGASLY